MANPRQQIFAPVGGMNQDDSIITPTPKYAGRNAFAEGDYKYLLNARVGSSNSDNFGDVETIKGTVEVTNYYIRSGAAWISGSRPSGTEKVVGRLENKELQRIYYCVYNSSGNHCIRYYDASTDIVYELLKWSGLSFSATDVIAMAMIDNWLSLTCRSFAPRLMDVDTISDLYNTLTTNFREFHISFHKWQPVMPPVLKAYYDGSNDNYDKFKNKVLQFSYRYVYNGGLKSRWSPISPAYAGQYREGINSGAVLSAPSFIGKGTASDNTTDTVTPAYPASIEEGDILFLFCMSYDAIGSLFADPSGWTLLDKGTYDNQAGTIVGSGAMYYKVATGSESGTVSVVRGGNTGAGTLTCGQIYQFRGSSDVTIEDYAMNNTGDGGTITWNELTLGGTGRTLVAFGGNAVAISIGDPSGYVQEAQDRMGSEFDMVFECCAKEDTDTDGQVTATGGSTDGWLTFHISLSQGNRGDEISSIKVHIPGCILDDPGAAVEYNYFNHDNTKFYNAVEYIEVAFREGARDLWRLLTRMEVQSSGNTVVDYSGWESANGTPVDDADFYQPFDVVPFRAGTVESIDNRFLFGDCLEEKAPADEPVVENVGVASVTLDENQDWWNYGSTNAAFNAAKYTDMSAADADEYAKRAMMSRLTFKDRGLYKVGIVFKAENGWKSGAYTCDDLIFEIPEAASVVGQFHALEFKLAASYTPPEWAVAYQIVRTNCLNIDYFMFGAVNSFSALIDNTTQTQDNQTVDASIITRIREHFENARLAVGTGALSKYLLNKPFFNSMASSIRSTSSAASVAAASRIYIDVNNWYNSSKRAVDGSTNNPMNKLFYNFREGDRVRFLGKASGAADYTVYDVPILEFTGRGLIIEKPADLSALPDDTGDNPLYYMVEVYTPKTPQQEDYLYHEVGEWHPILYPGTASRDFAKRDWTYTAPTAITCSTYGDVKVFNNSPFSYGDCHAMTVSMFTNVKSGGAYEIEASVASMNPDPSKLWDFWEKAIGRSVPSYANLPVDEYKPTMVRFGGRTLDDSLINEINRFRYEDHKVYPSEYGRIRILVATANAQVESAGAILLAIGEREAFSIYVNRTTLEDLSGRTQVALSDRVLGSYNVLLGSHGTFNPESGSLHRGRFYYWDAINGTWVRYGRDGLTAISTKYKMRNWFKELGRLMITKYRDADLPVAISGFDPFHDELITYNNHTDLPETFRDYGVYKGAAFSEEDTRWKFIHSYDPEMFGSLNDQLFSFKTGAIYKHDASDTNSTFYGTKRDVKIEPVFNAPPKDMKSWQGITIISSHGWSVERLLSEYRGAKTKQQSSINLADFEEKEDGYYAAIKNDENTPLVDYPLINGNKMRSKAIRALLKLDPSITTMSLLHYVLMGEIDSPKNS